MDVEDGAQTVTARSSGRRFERQSFPLLGELPTMADGPLLPVGLLSEYPSPR